MKIFILIIFCCVFLSTIWSQELSSQCPILVRLAKLEKIVKEQEEKINSLSQGKIQFYQKQNPSWWCAVASEKFAQVGELSYTFAVEKESLIIMVANGHAFCDASIPRPDGSMLPWIHVQFFIDNIPVMPYHTEYQGKFCAGTYAAQPRLTGNAPEWRVPFCLTQTAVVQPGSHIVQLQAMMAEAKQWNINGAGIQIVVIPQK